MTETMEKIKQALAKANSPYFVDERTGDIFDSNENKVADFIYHDADTHLIANAPA